MGKENMRNINIAKSMCSNIRASYRFTTINSQKTSRHRGRRYAQVPAFNAQRSTLTVHRSIIATTLSRPPCSTQSSQHNANSSECRPGLSPLPGAICPAFPIGKTLCHLKVPSCVKPRRFAAAIDARLSACACHCTRRMPRPFGASSSKCFNSTPLACEPTNVR